MSPTCWQVLFLMPLVHHHQAVFSKRVAQRVPRDSSVVLS